MLGSTISTTITQAVTFGSANYLTPLTILSSGAIIPTADATGLYGAATASGIISNTGVIEGGVPSGNRGLRGSDGVYLQGTVTFTNSGKVAGGAGGAGTIGGGGGVGIYLKTGLLTNFGQISGGVAATGVDGTGIPGFAVEFGETKLTDSLVNEGTITANSGAVVFLSNANVNNSGYIDVAAKSVAIEIVGQGSVTNTGVVKSGGDGVAMVGGGYLNNSGRGAIISGSISGVDVGDATATVVNSGSIYGGMLIQYGLNTVNNTGLIANANGTGIYLTGTMTNSGTVQGESKSVYFSLAAANRLIIDPGAVFDGMVRALGTTNVIELGTGRSAEILNGVGTSFVGFTTVDFDEGSVWNLSGSDAGFNKVTLSGFIAGDTLDVTDLTPDPEAHVVNLNRSAENVFFEDVGGTTLAFTVLHGTTPESITFSSDGSGGTEITTDLPCFCAGTRIATVVGEVKVEDLAIGDFVETLHSGLQKIKWIGRRSYFGRFIASNKDILPICIKRHAIAESVPARDLFVSPGHAICIDGALIHAFRLVNGVSITQAASVESVTYFHIETENHEVIYADNCPAETFIDENFRAQFQNAMEYRALYPGQSAAGIACLPRLENGFSLHAIQQRLNARADILLPPEAPGSLRGYVDEVSQTICSGWAQDFENPETPVCLDILVDGIRVTRVLANLYRADLRQAGLGSGCHAFRASLLPNVKGQMEVRRAADGAVLPWTEAASARAA